MAITCSKCGSPDYMRADRSESWIGQLLRKFHVRRFWCRYCWNYFYARDTRRRRPSPAR